MKLINADELSKTIANLKEGNNMSDLISRQAAIDAMLDLEIYGTLDETDEQVVLVDRIDAIEILRELPSAEPEPPEYCIDCPTFRKTQLLIPPREKGKWIRLAPDRTQCSKCGFVYDWTIERYHYCPNCGAKMGEKE